MAIGQISGQLLSKNLLRQGSDLAFETDLLYLDVSTNKIGIKTDSPATDLFIDNTIRTTDLIGDNSVTIANVSFNGDSSISTTIGPLYLAPNTPNPYINFTNLQTADLEFTDNVLKSKANSDIHLYPATGKEVKVFSDMNVYGNLHSTGDVTFDGNITFGSDADDSVTFASDIKSNIIPDVTDTYSLGTTLKRWKKVRAGNVTADTLYADDLTIDGIDTTLRQGNIYYVSKSGIDTNSGTHQNDTFLTIKKALSVATAGSQVQIYPGTYEEEFPLTVPAGVTVRGIGLRSVNIKPTVATQTEDCFLLNGESTVEDLSVKDFYYESSTDTGYAFKFAPNFTVTTRSPYIKNVSVITQESVTAATQQITVGPAPTLFSFTSDSVTLAKEFYSQALVDSLVGQIAVIDRYPLQPLYYIILSIEDEPSSPTTLWKMTVDTTFDPTGQLKPISFYPDIGLTQLITNDIWDTTGNSIGEKWVAWYKTNLPSFFTTLVQPGWTINVAGTIYIVDYIIEDPAMPTMWRIYVTTSLVGGVGIPIFSEPILGTTLTAGRGALVDGSVANASSVEASMLFHAVTMITPNSVALMMTNGVRVEWLNSFTYYASKGLYATNGTSGFAGLGTSFGAEVRSIGSANVYGLVGAEADGADTLMYLIQHNFGYIGTGTDSTNDRTLISQADEVVKLNGGKIYYTSQDQEGDFRIGDVFYADYQTGLTSFDTTGVNISGFSSLRFSNGVDTTFIDATTLDTGNLRVIDNTILSLFGDLNLDSASNTVNFLENVNVTKNLDVVGNFNLDGTLTFGNQATDTLQFNTTFDQDLNPNQNLENNLGNLADNKVWKTIYLSKAVVDTINIDSNVISAGTDEDVVLLGTDHVLVEQLTIRNNTISNEVAGSTTNLQKSIVLAPNGTGIVDITSTNALQVSVGTSTNMATLSTGDFRYNTTFENFEGNVGARQRFFTLQSENASTRITAELSRGANDNIIRFYSNNAIQATLDSSKFSANRLRISNNIDLDLNKISTVSTNSDLFLVPNGTGKVLVGNFTMISNDITNTDSGSVLTITPTGTGYVAFGGDGAVQFPAGTTGERLANPPIGATRWNVTRQAMEVFGPDGWQAATGGGADINAEAMDEITSLWALVLG